MPTENFEDADNGSHLVTTAITTLMNCKPLYKPRLVRPESPKVVDDWHAVVNKIKKYEAWPVEFVKS